MCENLTREQAGIRYVFVNLGSDHPSIIEAIVKGQNEKNGQFPRVITCPNEVSLSSSRIPEKVLTSILVADGGTVYGRWLCAIDESTSMRYCPR